MYKVKSVFFGLKKRHIWIAVSLALIILFQIFSSSRIVMNAVHSFTLWIKQILALILSPLPFSFAELLCAAAILGVIVYIIKAVYDIIRSGEKLRTLYRRFSLALAVLLTVYFALCAFLGASYYADGFQAKSGVYAKGGDVEELYFVTERFALRLSELSDKVARGENGEFSESLDDIFAYSTELYEGVSEKFSFLGQISVKPKRVAVSRLMSYFNYTGFYFPFTGEANINVAQPAAFVPSTIAHEMAHQRGIASEQEANFVAVLACDESGNDVYAYSGALMAYIHLSNALYRQSPDAYFYLYSSLPDNVKTDLKVNSDYWKQYENKAAAASEAVYDGFLKSYGQQLGVQSYGACVDLLIAYYGKV